VLRAESRPLSQQEMSDALASRLSFAPNDATLIDTDVTLLFDPEGEDVRAVIEFANTQLLEMRYLDAQLDEALEQAYSLLGRSPGLRRYLPSPYRLPLQRLGRLQLDAAVLFEQVTNALKLIGEQFLTRVYGHVSRRFHLAEWGREHHAQAADARRHLRKAGGPGGDAAHGAARMDHHRADRRVHRGCRSFRGWSGSELVGGAPLYAGRVAESSLAPPPSRPPR